MVDDEIRVMPSLGHVEIDKQHGSIFTILEKIGNSDGFNDDQLSLVLSELTDSVFYHFEFEEKLLNMQNDQSFFDHLLEHRKFKKKISEICFRFIMKKDCCPEDIRDTLSSWFVNHITLCDRVDLKGV